MILAMMIMAVNLFVIRVLNWCAVFGAYKF
jgi:hypothetical protein